MYSFIFTFMVLLPCQANYEYRGMNTNLDASDDNPGFIQQETTQHSPGSWPWVCSLGTYSRDNKDDWDHICTGTIVSTSHVITTVGCVEQCQFVKADDELILVRAGDDNLKYSGDNDGVQIKNISSITNHPLYNETHYQGYYDIAILKLESDLKFTLYVRPIALPEVTNEQVILKEDLDNKLLIFSYYGSQEIIATKYILIQPTEICQKLSGYNYIYNYTFNMDLSCGMDPSLKRICDVGEKYKELEFGSAVIQLDKKINRYVLKGFITILYDDYEREACQNNNRPNMIVPILSKSNADFIFNELDNKLYDITLKNQPALIDNIDEMPSSSKDDDFIYENCGRNSILDKEPDISYSQLKKYPWQVSIGQFSSSPNKEWIHFCGGSVVTRTKIITAAHCIPNLRKRREFIKVRAGDDKLQNKIDNEGLQIIETTDFKMHPRYSSKRYFDVGIVTLNSPLKITKFVRPICLLSLEEAKRIQKEDEIDLPLIITGYGKDDSNIYRDEVLRVISAIILSEERCNETYQDNLKQVPDLFSSDLLCASDPKGYAGTCNGDSGGPAIHLNQNMRRYFLRGIISGSGLESCGTKLFPNIYVRTANDLVLKWILSQIEGPPRTILIEGKNKVQPNQSIEYGCLVDSYPVSKIILTVTNKPGDVIKTENSSGAFIKFNTTQQSPRFELLCNARNRLGTRTFTKTVQIASIESDIGLPNHDPEVLAIILGLLIAIVIITITVIVYCLWKHEKLPQLDQIDILNCKCSRKQSVQIEEPRFSEIREEQFLLVSPEGNAVGERSDAISRRNGVNGDTNQLYINVESKLCEKFSQISVSWSAVERAKNAIENKSIDSWIEDVKCPIMRGIAQDKIDAAIDDFARRLDLPKDSDNKLRDFMRSIKNSKYVADTPYEVLCEVAEYRSIYGFVCMAKEDDETISIAGAVQKLSFKLSNSNIIIQDIEDVKTHYCKNKILEHLKSEGVIQVIKYEE